MESGHRVPLTSAELMNLGTLKTDLGDVDHTWDVCLCLSELPTLTCKGQLSQQGPAGLGFEFLLPFLMASYI